MARYEEQDSSLGNSTSDNLTIEVFAWNDHFATGIKVLDNQHKKLVALINELANTCVNQNNVAIQTVFEQLLNYAHHHFSTEEKIWQQAFNDDDWYTKHQQSHQQFLPQLNQFLSENKQLNSPEVLEQVVSYLIKWLAIHILQDDMRMTYVLDAYQQGVSISQAKILANEKMLANSSRLADTLLDMFHQLSSRTLELMRERHERQNIEAELRANNELLQKMVITDQLTQLYNRRYFEQIFDRELKRAQRNKSPLSLFIFDIDYFKKLNDHYGHLAGDSALEKVSTCLAQLCRRPHDYCFRIGGEEFALVTSKLCPEQAFKFAESIRREIAELTIPNQASYIGEYLTISIGVVTKIPTKDDTQDSFFSTADERLYQAKAAGRNQVIAN